MKKIFVSLIAASMFLSGCDSPAPDAKDRQADKAQEAANRINFTENAEIGNIEKRLKLTSNPGQIGFILLLNEMGQPVMYGSVKGKITSGSKRLTPPVKRWNIAGAYELAVAPSDEGTWGSSDPYSYWWDMNGQYHQWNGKYLYSDKPFRITVSPIIVTDLDKSGN